MKRLIALGSVVGFTLGLGFFVISQNQQSLVERSMPITANIVDQGESMVERAVLDESKLEPCVREGEFVCRLGDANYGCLPKDKCRDYLGMSEAGISGHD